MRVREGGGVARWMLARVSLTPPTPTPGRPSSSSQTNDDMQEPPPPTRRPSRARAQALDVLDLADRARQVPAPVLLDEDDVLDPHAAYALELLQHLVVDEV